MQRYPETVFEISSQTDPTGDNHLELASQRIDSVLSYLQTKHRVNPLRFVKVPAGAELALGNVDQTADFQEDRRVTITGADSYPQTALYRYILEAVRDGHLIKASKWLHTWLFMATDRQVMLAQYDPRLNNLLNKRPLSTVYSKRKSRIYGPIDRKNGKAFLDSIWHEDQLPRTLGKYLENLFSYVEALDSSTRFWRVNYTELTLPGISSRDSIHSIMIKEWLEANGWPLESEVGALAAKAVPLALIHGGDTATIAKFLPVIYARCRNGEADWEHYTLLFDRNQVTRQLPQRYGTQYKRNPITGEQDLLPVEDWAEMNRLRQQIGASPILPVSN
jgi:hypothetical protein